MNKFEVNYDEIGDEWHEVDAIDAERAAEWAAETFYDEDPCDPDRFALLIRVREKGEELFGIYEVTAEARVKFMVREK